MHDRLGLVRQFIGVKCITLCNVQIDQISKTLVVLATVNVAIFACIHFRRSMKMGNFACTKIPVLSIIGSLGYYEGNFRGVHIFADT